MDPMGYHLNLRYNNLRQIEDFSGETIGTSTFKGVPNGS